MDHHCLRVLPEAANFACTTASLFGALQETFDFQVLGVQFGQSAGSRWNVALFGGFSYVFKHFVEFALSYLVFL